MSDKLKLMVNKLLCYMWGHEWYRTISLSWICNLGTGFNKKFDAELITICKQCGAIKHD